MSFNKLQDLWIIKACVCYFLSNFYFSRNDSPSKTMKNVFYFIKKALFVLEIFKFLYFHLTFFLSNHCFRGCSKINLQVYDVINCLKNLITYFVWYFEKKKSYAIENLSIVRVLNKEHFYWKIMQKICNKS